MAAKDTKHKSCSATAARIKRGQLRRAEHDLAGHSSRSSSLGEQLQPQSCSKLSWPGRVQCNSRRDVHECV